MASEARGSNSLATSTGRPSDIVAGEGLEEQSS